MQVHFSQALYKSNDFIFFKARLVYYYKIITLIQTARLVEFIGRNPELLMILWS